MEDVLSTEIPGDFGEALKTGVLICEVINKIEPGKIPKISKKTMPFPQRENIKAFTDAVRDLGVPDAENFETGDLFEQSNMKQVLICIQSLGRASKRVRGYDGPTLAVGGAAAPKRGSSSSSKIKSLGAGLKIGMVPPPPTVGSMEWLEAERVDKVAAETGSGSVLKDAAQASLGSMKMIMPGMGGPPNARGPTSQENADAPKLDSHPTAGRAKKVTRKPSTRRPGDRRPAARPTSAASPSPEPAPVVAPPRKKAVAPPRTKGPPPRKAGAETAAKAAAEAAAAAAAEVIAKREEAEEAAAEKAAAEEKAEAAAAAAKAAAKAEANAKAEAAEKRTAEQEADSVAAAKPAVEQLR
jgi:hypothetical protein